MIRRNMLKLPLAAAALSLVAGVAMAQDAEKKVIGISIPSSSMSVGSVGEATTIGASSLGLRPSAMSTPNMPAARIAPLAP